ncbi:hypothetical protein LMH73_020320 [Vibrio splendidus]|nr:hypothetical protein [Vibrio splendidus]MCC4880555.1 hypothetical protein [Vibrio splendidus]
MLFEIDEDPIAFANELSVKHKYKPLSNSLSQTARGLYLSKLPEWCELSGSETPLMTKSGIVVAKGYSRTVVGDYGAYIEIDKELIVRSAICCQKGEEYRFRDPAFSNSVKYFWYTAKDSSGVKIYYQQKTVKYADYLVGKFYISPYELEVNRN